MNPFDSKFCLKYEAFLPEAEKCLFVKALGDIKQYKAKKEGYDA